MLQTAPPVTVIGWSTVHPSQNRTPVIWQSAKAVPSNPMTTIPTANRRLKIMAVGFLSFKFP
jgi:hypothetical protein